MNRKTAIKGILTGLAIAVPSVSIFEWLHAGSGINLNSLFKKKHIIADLAETIIPRTDTPGAKDAKVEDFIISMIVENSDFKTQQTFLQGLKKLERYSFEQYLTTFSHCSLKHQKKILAYFEDKANYRYQIINKVYIKVFGPPFFLILKNLTVKGYCTSIQGATMGMAYLDVPGSFEPCVPLINHQKAWATK